MGRGSRAPTCFPGLGGGRSDSGGCGESPAASSWNGRASATGHLAALEAREKKSRSERQKGTRGVSSQPLQVPPTQPSTPRGLRKPHGSLLTAAGKGQQALRGWLVPGPPVSSNGGSGTSRLMSLEQQLKGKSFLAARRLLGREGSASQICGASSPALGPWRREGGADAQHRRAGALPQHPSVLSLPHLLSSSLLFLIADSSSGMAIS